MGLLGILVALGFLIWLAYRGWSILLLAPAASIIAAALSGQPLLAHWTQTFMASAAQFVMQFFPIFLLGALFGKLMEDSGSVSAIATFMTERLGAKRAVLAVVLPGRWSPMAASASSSPSSCSPRWRMRCFARPRFRSG
jgi:H+/gluconate symporter-like permease